MSGIKRIAGAIRAGAGGRLTRLERNGFWLGLRGLTKRFWVRLSAVIRWVWDWVERLLPRPWIRRTLVTVVVVCVGANLLLWLLSGREAVSEPAYKIRYLDQGKGWEPTLKASDRQTFYNTPQGTSLLATGFRYNWITHLEQNGSAVRFMDPAHMRALGFQVDNVSTELNPDHLPVGFTKHFAPEFNDEVLDITCAACHTGELIVNVNGQTTGIRIDGGQAMHAFTSTSPEQFGSSLLYAMADTMVNPLKFWRFARSVLGDRFPWAGPSLLIDMVKVTSSMGWQAADDWLHNRYPVPEGFGRTDAIGRIANRVFGTDLDSRNFAQGNAPVSYPAIWDAHHWDWVQYAASVSQPMSRNVGESLGVGATLQLVDSYGRPFGASERFIAGTLVDDLNTIEEAISSLRAPQWPADLLGKVDVEKADNGKCLFERHCARCHEPCLKPKPEVEIERPNLAHEEDTWAQLWKVKAIPVEEVGTDPLAAMNFANRKIWLSKTGLTREDIVRVIEPIVRQEYWRKKKAYVDYGATPLRGSAPDPGDEETYINRKLDEISVDEIPIGKALNYVDQFVIFRSYQQMFKAMDQSQREKSIDHYNGDGALDLPQVKMVYKARPLDGVWATAPYLHNGSVPTLDDLLSPVSDRPKKFFVANRLYFDSRRVGLLCSRTVDHGFWLDTTIPGNSNAGHEFRAGYSNPGRYGIIGPELTPKERSEIIEYLKIYKSDPQPCKPARGEQESWPTN